MRLCADRHVLRVYAESCWWLLVVAGMCVCANVEFEEQSVLR